MPILAAERNLHPLDLFEERSAGIAGLTWWVLHTRPRQEKSLARELLKLNVAFYLPLIAHRNLIRGRVMESQLPLFPGYLFLLGSPEQRIAALSTRRVVRSLPVPDQGRLSDDLNQVFRLIRSGLPVRPEDRLETGATVVIRSGPLTGLRGVILKAGSGGRFFVQVDFIQRGASVLLDDFALAAVNSEDQAGTSK
jgi:hypothetical protein